MSLQLFSVILLFVAVGCFGLGMFAGRRIWGPQWLDTSEGIDRKFRKLRF